MMNIAFQVSTAVFADEFDQDSVDDWVRDNHDAFVQACLDGGRAALKAANLPAAPPTEGVVTSDSPASN